MVLWSVPNIDLWPGIPVMIPLTHLCFKSLHLRALCLGSLGRFFQYIQAISHLMESLEVSSHSGVIPSPLLVPDVPGRSRIGQDG
ncbi:uncharacterized protein VTP21DRAFT_5520 [Calcarisporiella thermophila]|uniref:uncharacterized protein n=1 Tax=Calcarisporiella thermophila TaxID=911321 RepID=UPI003742C895